MIEKKIPYHNFQQSEIQNGDIICFQKALTENEYVLLLYIQFFNTVQIITLEYFNILLEFKNIQQ